MLLGWAGQLVGWAVGWTTGPGRETLEEANGAMDKINERQRRGVDG